MVPVSIKPALATRLAGPPAATCYWYEHILLPLLGDTEPGYTIPGIDSWVTFKVGRGLARRPMSMQAFRGTCAP